MLEPSVPAVGLMTVAKSQCMYLYLLFRQIACHRDAKEKHHRKSVAEGMLGVN